MSVTLLLGEDSFSVPREHLLLCGLFEKNPSLLSSPYTVRTSTPASTFTLFLDALSGGSPSLTPATAAPLSALCEEFEFGPLSLSLCRYYRSTVPLDYAARLQSLSSRLDSHARLLSRLEFSALSARRDFAAASARADSALLAMPAAVERELQSAAARFAATINEVRYECGEAMESLSGARPLVKREAGTAKLILMGACGAGRSWCGPGPGWTAPPGGETVAYAERTVRGPRGPVVVHLWNADGVREKSEKIAEVYAPKMHAFVLLYAVTSRASFEELPKLIAAIRPHRAVGAAMIVVAWKALGARVVAAEEGQAIAFRERALFAEIADSDEEIEAALSRVVGAIKE